MNSNQSLAHQGNQSPSCSRSISTPKYMTPSVIKMVKQEPTSEGEQIESVSNNKEIEVKKMAEKYLEESSFEVPSEEGTPTLEKEEHHVFERVGVNQGNRNQNSTKPTLNQRNAWGDLSYADLITRAILSSPNKKMTLQEIYAWISDNIPYFMDKKDGPTTTGWKNSVRHTLSIRKRFIRLPNIAFGSMNYKSLWTVDPHAEARRRNPSRHLLNYQVESPRLEVANWSQRLSVWTARPLDRATQTELPNTWCPYCGHLAGANYSTGNAFDQGIKRFQN